MITSRQRGDQHVREVHAVLLHKLTTDTWPEQASSVSLQTARYVWEKFPHPDNILCKFDYPNPDDHNDLIIIKGPTSYPVNLFIVKGSGIIQPKNPGAKSFLSRYFLTEELQERFNQFMELEYLYFLQELLELKDITYIHLPPKRELKSKVKELFPHFDKDTNLLRDRFLLKIRDYCFTLLQHNYNTNQAGFINAFNELLMTRETNIITRSRKKGVTVEEFAPEMGHYQDIIVYKKGKNIIGIHYGSIALTLRFKFESSPASSIKLATSFESYRTDFRSEIIQKNNRTLQQINQILYEMNYNPNGNVSNAVGKCHEAFTYYWILKQNPDVIQADDEECTSYLLRYLPRIDRQTAAAIQESSEKTAAVILEFIQKKKNNAILEGIQLVADIYTSDRLNTGDLKISIRYINGNVEEIYISLKAISKIGQKITTKNPGIGTILSRMFFDVREDLNEKVSEVKKMYENGLDRYECLVTLSQEIGFALEQAPQENLKRGINNLLGKALMIITAYEQKKAFHVEYSQIKGNVIVKRNTPSNIQNTLLWNNGDQQLSLRVKFSKGESHGWSSIKLTSEYLYKPNL
ncbi:hypothetical protein ACAF76_010465 [Brevibacillus sp. TJ4]|uniref:hypothetical protein n=1 Tax=Brevibacillus sp. TJ4 TaxID=3234853 RepID=UPI003BA2EB05